jgi:hypothetical protein
MRNGQKYYGIYFVWKCGGEIFENCLFEPLGFGPLSVQIAGNVRWTQCQE